MDIATGPFLGARLPARERIASRGRTRLAWGIAAGALLLDVLVSVPFLYDPWGWREPTLAAPGAPARSEYVLFLAAPVTAARRDDLRTRHPALRVEHHGGLGDTLVVSLPSGEDHSAERLRGDPAVRLMMRGVAGLCRAT
jgi:hypothetical protein